MFSSYPTTTVLPTRRAQTPPISSLPTSPSDEVGRRQSLTSPDSQSARPANRTGACTTMHYDTQTSWHSRYMGHYYVGIVFCFYWREKTVILMTRGLPHQTELSSVFWNCRLNLAIWERNNVLYTSVILDLSSFLL